MNGIILIDKPSGMTSHDVVSVVRRKLQTRKVGHAGTLDPLATGLLVVLVGKATKQFDKFVGFDKAYNATMILGTRTDSADITGKILAQESYGHITLTDVTEAFKKFEGEIEQVPPMVSAVRIGGQRLYNLARKGIEIERPARKVRIDKLLITKFQSPEVSFILECSKGTYVRQIAEDVGQVLGCGACISEIRRTKVGTFSLTDAVVLGEVNASHIRDW